ncbi:MAG TPA: enoyl-CoA hydratase [Polyangiales bacterium]|nr:enoyl-CoA hydratase [Polyangiales bacterium]
MASETEKLIARKDGAIGQLIFNNPERRNALSIDMWQGIPAILEAFERDPEVRVVMFAGAGDKAFVSGADISQFESARFSAEADDRYSALTDAALHALAQLAKPSIAMIRGFCIGGGLAVALSCDLRVAAEDAKFGIPAARLGLGYRFDGVKKLVDIVGPANASEILFTARHVDAQDALRMGLVNKVVPVADLENTARAYAGWIADNAPLTVRASKLAVREAVTDPERRDLGRVDAAIVACFQSADFVEGRTAFLEKRRPKFSGT